jgi:hypothetical protein
VSEKPRRADLAYREVRGLRHRRANR